MKEFQIRLRSVREVQSFVSLATTMGFPVLVGDRYHQVDGDCFMEMFCLDCTRPLTVSAQCSDEEFEKFRTAAESFLAK